MRPGRLGLCELAVLLTVLAVLPLGVASTGAEPKPDPPPRVWLSSAYQPPQRCPAAQDAISHYRRAYTRSRKLMGLPGAVPRQWYPCPAARRRALEWRDKAEAARRKADAYVHYHWGPPPEPFLSIARCENRGDGLYGVNWDAYNSVYEGAYGFLHSTWDAYKPAGYPDSASTATIAQQTHVARILVATFGGYSSWPACHIRLGLPG